MNWLEITSISIILVYAVFILVNMVALVSQRQTISPQLPLQRITVIIPCRNEEENILTCLADIRGQNYPKELLQVLVVDDHSEDRTSALTVDFLSKNFPDATLIQLQGAERGKKTALLKAILQAKGTIIVTRDADTFGANSNWLRNISHEFSSGNCDLLIMPTLLQGNESLLSTFQQLENLAMNALGSSMARMGLPFVCGGANLAYQKSSFMQADPYRDNLHVASGDDMFLLKCFWKKGLSIRSSDKFQKVYTKSESSSGKALSQRIRWASKSGKISIFPVYFTGFLVAAANLVCAVSLLLPFINRHYLTVSLLCLGLKLIIDFLLLFLSARMYKQKVSWPWLPPAFLLNGLYVPFTLLASVTRKSTWKSRRI
jgi:cellulose synthase/poly-beta-1,6-N-acetylglucosamine synthase-like glycosyltransferase